jgi:hypothetical protein
MLFTMILWMRVISVKPIIHFFSRNRHVELNELWTLRHVYAYNWIEMSCLIHQRCLIDVWHGCSIALIVGTSYIYKTCWTFNISSYMIEHTRRQIKLHVYFSIFWLKKHSCFFRILICFILLWYMTSNDIFSRHVSGGKSVLWSI